MVCCSGCFAEHHIGLLVALVSGPPIPPRPGQECPARAGGQPRGLLWHPRSAWPLQGLAASAQEVVSEELLHCFSAAPLVLWPGGPGSWGRGSPGTGRWLLCLILPWPPQPGCQDVHPRLADSGFPHTLCGAGGPAASQVVSMPHGSSCSLAESRQGMRAQGEPRPWAAHSSPQAVCCGGGALAALPAGAFSAPTAPTVLGSTCSGVWGGLGVSQPLEGFAEDQGGNQRAAACSSERALLGSSARHCTPSRCHLGPPVSIRVGGRPSPPPSCTCKEPCGWRRAPSGGFCVCMRVFSVFLKPLAAAPHSVILL